MPFIGDQATANAKIKKHVFTAEGSQTAFAVASNAGDELQVFLNGVLLKLTDDYTYTTSTVTLGSGATVSDIVEVHVYQSFALVDAVKASGDTMTGELEVPTVKLSSNVVKASDGTTAITTSGANITLAGTTNNIGTVTSGTFNSTIGTSATMSANQACVKTAINASGSAPIYACRAWARVQADGSITGSQNVSGVSASSGAYTLSFSTAMPNTNYSVCLSLGEEQAGLYFHYLHTASTGSVLIKTHYDSGYYGVYTRAFSIAIFD